MKIWNLKEVRRELNPDSKQKFKVWRVGVPEDSKITYLRLDQNYNTIELLVVNYLGYEIKCGTIGVLEKTGKFSLCNWINDKSKLCLNGENKIVLKNNEITCNQDNIESKFKFKVWADDILNETPDTTYFRLIEESDKVKLIAVTSEGCMNGAGYILEITEKGKLELIGCISERLGLSLDSRKQLILNNTKSNTTYGGN